MKTPDRNSRLRIGRKRWDEYHELEVSQLVRKRRVRAPRGIHVGGRCAPNLPRAGGRHPSRGFARVRVRDGGAAGAACRRPSRGPRGQGIRPARARGAHSTLRALPRERRALAHAHDGTGGAGGSIKREFLLEPRVDFTIGASTVTLEDVAITSERTHAALDILFGNIGQDLLNEAERATLDFTSMTFALGPLRASAGNQP